MNKKDQAIDGNKITDLEKQLRKYEEIIENLKEDRDNFKNQLLDHTDRLERIENLKTSSKSIHGDPNEITDKIKELEYELKLLVERIKEIQLKINDLVKRNKEAEKNQDGDESENLELKEIEDIRKQLEGELNSLKGRNGQIEDRIKMLLMKLKDQLIKEGRELDSSREDSEQNREENGGREFSDEKINKMTEETENLKVKISNLEEMLKKLKRKRKIIASMTEGTDYTLIIEELRDDLEADIKVLKEKTTKIEEDQGKTEFRSKNNEARVESLENLYTEQNNELLTLSKDMRNHKSNLSEIEKKIKDLKQLTNEKVDTDTFEQEMTCKN